MAKVKVKFGFMACPDCGDRVRVKANERETLSYSCDECDSEGYRRKGTAAYDAWLKKITRDTPAAPKPAPDPKPAPAPKPAADPRPAAAPRSTLV